MPTVYALKPSFKALLRPTAGRLATAGVTANQVTIAATVLSLGWGALIAVTGGATLALLGLPLVLLLRMELNAIDGMMAREYGQMSRLGFFLNEAGDIVSDAALYLPLMLVLAPAGALLAGAAAVAMALTEMAGVLGLSGGGTRRYDGPFGKSDRAVYFSVLAVAVGTVALPAWLPLAAIAVALALSLITVVNRVAASLRETADD